jgi:hypothetical protein
MHLALLRIEDPRSLVLGWGWVAGLDLLFVLGSVLALVGIVAPRLARMRLLYGLVSSTFFLNVLLTLAIFALEYQRQDVLTLQYPNEPLVRLAAAVEPSAMFFACGVLAIWMQFVLTGLASWRRRRWERKR